ncbi:glycosyl hydrolase, partial [Bacillaceae bacterium Marseille-Q3522]|nr:glycosyl hydrolase [Bacillaceae bacterium Marseille-Q3522]
GKRYPINLEEKNNIRSPKEEYALFLQIDLGYFMRDRFRKYVRTLRGFFEEYGVEDTIFLINIHGTEHNRGLSFPIGISQLYEAYTQDSKYLSGSDHYLGNFKVENFQDLYLMNAYMEASNLDDQPISSIEFECGDGNYGVFFGQGHLDVSAADFKMRMSIAQGNRLLNYYLFAGGKNYLLDVDIGDGNNRISFQGEEHGIAAPIGPTGKINYTYPRLATATNVIMASAEKLAKANEERDNVAFAFIPDYFMTEYQYPASQKVKEVIKNLEEFRSGGAWNNLARAMLFGGYRFSAIDIQNNKISQKNVQVLIVPSAKYMAKEVQEKLAAFMEAGGSILIYGQLPIYDLEGNPCSVLANVLEVEILNERRTKHDHVLHIVGDSWAKGRPDLTVYHVQEYKGKHFTPIFRTYDSRDVCAFETKYKKGKAVVFGTQQHGDVAFFTEMLSRLGAKKGLSHKGSASGIFMTTTKTKEEERFLHIINFDQYDQEISIYDNGTDLFHGNKLMVQANEAMMLPINVTYHDIVIKYSSAEVMKVEKDAIEFRLTQPKDFIVIKTRKEVKPSNDYVIIKDDDDVTIHSNKHAKISQHLRVQFQ